VWLPVHLDAGGRRFHRCREHDRPEHQAVDSDRDRELADRFELLSCPDPDGGTVAANAVVQLYPTIAGGCSNSPERATGTITFEPATTGIAGTFDFNLYGGMTGAFSFVQDPDLCEAPSVCPDEPFPDAGPTVCEADGGCGILDAGSLSGGGELSVRGQDPYGENQCFGPLDISTQATFSETFGSPTIKVGSDTEGWELEADLSCCPSGEGSLPANMVFHTSLPPFGAMSYCSSSGMPTGGVGTVTFTQTDAGAMAGWMVVDAGTVQSFATFEFPAP
jgi:hypothetical protein